MTFKRHFTTFFAICIKFIFKLVRKKENEKKTRIYMLDIITSINGWWRSEEKKHLQITHYYVHIHTNAELCQQLVNVYVVSCN